MPVEIKTVGIQYLFYFWIAILRYRSNFGIMCIIYCH